MLEIIKAIFTFRSYYDDTNKIKKTFLVLKNFCDYLKWYLENNEVKIKYSQIIKTKAEEGIINTVHETLKNADIKFTDDFSKTSTELSFEVLNSKLSYRIAIERIDELEDNIIFETKYIPFYPFRKFKELNEITNEFNMLSGLIKNPLKISDSRKIIFIEMIKIETKNSEVRKFKKFNAEIIFKNNKIQINNLEGTEHAEFMLFFIIKWLREYR